MRRNRTYKMISFLLIVCMTAGLLVIPKKIVKATENTTAEIPTVTTSYIDYDFETLNAEGAVDTAGLALLPKNTENKVEAVRGNHYLYLEKNASDYPQIYRNLTQVIDSDYLVISMDIASTKLSGTYIKVKGQTDSLYFAGYNAQGQIMSCSQGTGGTMVADGEYVNFTIAINSTDSNYSLWVDGTKVVADRSISAAFGRVTTVTVEMTYSTETGVNAMVDNLKVYSYTPDAAETGIPAVTTSYIDNTFEHKIASTGEIEMSGLALLPKNAENKVELAGGNNYIYMEKNASDYPQLYCNLASVIDSDYVVVSADIATTNLSNTYIKVKGQSEALYFAGYNAQGQMMSCSQGTGLTMIADGEYVNFVIAINSVDSTYSLWIDGVKVVADRAISSTFGRVTAVTVEMTYSTETGMNAMVDNLKVYGYTPSDGSETETPQAQVYYDLDFEEDDDLTEITRLVAGTNTASRIEGTDGNGYLEIVRNESGNAKVLVNYGGETLSDYVVFEADVASTDLGSTFIKIIGDGGTGTFATFTSAGEIWNSSNATVGSITEDGTVYNFAVAINSETQTYSVWLDGAMIIDGAAIPVTNYGKAKYLQIEMTSGTGANFRVDNLRIYDGEFPRDNPYEEYIDPGSNRYYDNDFETESTDELTLLGGAAIAETAEGNHYISLIPGAYFLWNYGSKYDLSEYVVIQADIASTETGTTFLKVYGESGNSCNLVVVNSLGNLSPADEATQSKLAAGEVINVAIAINSVDNTYSVWYDGTLVVDDSALPVSEFGDAWYTRFEMTGGSATANLMVDNLKVFNGHTPNDFANTTVPTRPEKDESWLEDCLGTDSSILDYATEELALIDAANAVMVHTGSLYVYENQARVQKTQAEVDAILANTEGKTVIENQTGLVIISDSTLALTEDQIDSLHDYMLYTRPQLTELKALFTSVTTNEHPRIVLDSAKFARIISDYQTNAVVKAWADSVISTADTYLNAEHVKYERPDGTRMTSCRAILDRALNLSMAYKLTGLTKYKDFLWEDLEIAGNFLDWNHEKHYLDTGEFAAGFAIAYDWLYADWTAEQRAFLEEAIYENALYYQHRYMYGVTLSGLATYITTETNRSAVCNGGIGLAALAVFDVYPDKCADILEKTYHVLENMMGEFALDGANIEGPAYWEYMMRFLSKFMASTELTFGTDFNLYKAPGFETTGEYYLDVDGMTGANNFHDATASTHLYSGYLFWVSNALDKPGLTKANLYKMNQFNLKGDIYSLVYYDSDILMDSTINMPLDAYYRNLELVSMRSSWIDSRGIYASIHSGETNVSHAHIDSGTFVVDIGGQRFAGDIGKEDYNLAAVGTNRYYYYRLRPEGHNVFVINPDTTGEDLGQNINASEVISEFVTKDKGAYTIVSLDSCYEGYATSATRGLMLSDERRSVLIRDEIRGMTLDQNEVYWFMQMENVQVEIAEDKKSAVLTKGGVDVHLQVATNATDYEIRLMDATEMYPKTGLADQDAQTPNTNWSRLAIVFTTGSDVNINVKMAVLGDPMGDTPISDVSLENWSIPDGALAEFPKLGGITIGGQALPGFDENVTSYKYTLPYGTESCPTVTATASAESDNCEILITTPTEFPGELTIQIIDKADSRLRTTYTVRLRVQGDVSIEASGSQEGNPPENCLDDDLSTRWAVEGEAYGIFRFVEAKTISAVSIASWLANQRYLNFDIQVSTDGVTFTEVLTGGKTTVLAEDEADQLESFAIPQGTYLAVKLVLHGSTYPTGSTTPWNSILEVEFTEVTPEE